MNIIDIIAVIAFFALLGLIFFKLIVSVFDAKNKDDDRMYP